VSIPHGTRATSEPDQPTAAAEGRAAAVAHAATELQLGEWVGEYVVLRKLGEGGFGAVYEALHPVIGKRAAVKVLHAQYSGDASVASRFAAEARAVNQIRHRNIVDIFSFGELADGRHYYVMELLEGVPLDTYLDRVGRLEPVECLLMLTEIAKALFAAHEAGIAHRDLKPENVFLELDDEHHVYPKILDFGMAKLLAPGTLPMHKTRSGAPIGSPRYMSPEQCRGVEVDHRTDVYSFGAMAFRALAGVPPFDAGTALELMMAHVSAPPPTLSSVGPDLGPKVDESLLKMLEKLPEHRPQSILEASESLGMALQMHSADSQPSGPLLASAELVELARERAQSRAPELDISKLRRTPGSFPLERTRVHSWVWVGVPIVLLLGVAAFAWQQQPYKTSVTSIALTSSAVAVADVVASVLPAATKPEEVSITVYTVPVGAELYLNKNKVGVAPGPLHLPQNDLPVTLTVKSPGRLPQSVQFVPSGDKTLHITLPSHKPRAGASVPSELEDPY
jgi:serine/threonine-protein kinase